MADITKLYFRFEYTIETGLVNKVMLGIQYNETLNITKKTPKISKHQSISLIEEIKQEKIKLHLVFESDVDINRVRIEKPILIDLNYFNRSTWVKWMLDLTIKYRKGYSYKNLYENSELIPGIKDLEEFNFEKGKTGSIIKTDKDIKIKLSAKFIENKYYLVKLDYKEINELGELILSYGTLKATLFNKEQQYILLKGNPKSELVIEIKPNDILPYIVNLKHLLITQAGGMNLMKSDIPYLTFI